MKRGREYDSPISGDLDRIVEMLPDHRKGAGAAHHLALRLEQSPVLGVGDPFAGVAQFRHRPRLAGQAEDPLCCACGRARLQIVEQNLGEDSAEHSVGGGVSLGRLLVHKDTSSVVELWVISPKRPPPFEDKNPFPLVGSPCAIAKVAHEISFSAPSACQLTHDGLSIKSQHPPNSSVRMQECQMHPRLGDQYEEHRRTLSVRSPAFPPVR